MRFKIGEGSGNQFIFLHICHDDKFVEWNIDTYKRSVPNDINTVFSNINGFLATLPDSTQFEIYEIFEDLLNTFNEINDIYVLQKEIQKRVKKLYKILNFEDVKQWVMINGTISAPEDLKESYSGIDNELTKRLTYLRYDYYELSAFSTYLKPMVPIFGEYIRRVGKEVGTKFKEHFAFSLLSTSNVIELKPFVRLKDYVIAKALNEERKKPGEYRRNSAVFGGLGTEELPDWLLTRAIVRRVAIHEEATGDNIVANIFHNVDQQISSLDKTFNGRVSDKKLYGGQSEEDNVSIAENYKVKQEISDGDLSVLSVYTEEMYKMASRVDPTFDRSKLNICANLAMSSGDINILNHQITFTQWVLSKAISPRGIPSLSKPALLKAMAVTQALLWHWEFYELAAFMFATPCESVSLAAGITTTRLNKEQAEAFFEIYPHYQPVSKSAHNLRGVNVACKSIDLISLELTQNDWILKGPAELLESNKMRVNSTHVTSAEIRQLLGSLLLKIREIKLSDITHK